MEVIVKTRAGKRVGLLYCTSDFLSKACKAMSAESNLHVFTQTNTHAQKQCQNYLIVPKHSRQTASLLLFLSHHPLCCVCVCECLRLRGLPVNHSLSHWISRMGGCVNTDGGLGPFDTSPMAHLSPRLSGASFLYLIMFVHIPQSSHKSPLLPGSVFFFFFLLFWSHNPGSPRQISADIQYPLTLVPFLFNLAAPLSFFFFLTPRLSFDLLVTHAIQSSRFPFFFLSLSFRSARTLSCLSRVCCLMFHSVSPSVVPLDLLFFLFSFSMSRCFILIILLLLLRFISLTIKCKELNSGSFLPDWVFH